MNIDTPLPAADLVILWPATAVSEAIEEREHFPSVEAAHDRLESITPALDYHDAWAYIVVDEGS